MCEEIKMNQSKSKSDNNIFMLFLLKDLQELRLIDTKTSLEEGGYKLSNEFLKKYDKASNSLRTVLKETRVMTNASQEEFGEISDLLHKILNQIVDSTDLDKNRLEGVLKLLESREVEERLSIYSNEA